MVLEMKFVGKVGRRLGVVVESGRTGEVNRSRNSSGMTVWVLNFIIIGKWKWSRSFNKSEGEGEGGYLRYNRYGTGYCER